MTEKAYEREEEIHGEDIGEENTKPGEEEVAEMSLLEHLEELRRRLIRSIVVIFLGMLCCVPLSKEIFNYLMLPLFRSLPPHCTMIYTSPHEAFFVYLKTAFISGFFLTLPYTFYQIWLFVKPGLYPEERRFIIPIALSSAVLFLLGGMFGYFIIFPFAYKFFLGFANVHISPMISMKEGLAFAVRLLLAFGIVFELPVVVFFLARLGLVTAATLRRFRKYAILIAFIVGAVLTPPDAMTQCLMAGPLVILYEVGIWIAYIFGKKDKKKKKQARDDQEISQKAIESTSQDKPQLEGEEEEDGQGDKT